MCFIALQYRVHDDDPLALYAKGCGLRMFTDNSDIARFVKDAPHARPIVTGNLRRDTHRVLTRDLHLEIYTVLSSSLCIRSSDTTLKGTRARHNSGRRRSVPSSFQGCQHIFVSSHTAGILGPFWTRPTCWPMCYRTTTNFRRPCVNIIVSEKLEGTFGELN